MAPEILVLDCFEKDEREPYTLKIDVWSIGVVLYVMLSNDRPIVTENQIHGKKLTFETRPWWAVSHTAKALLEKLLERDVNKRYAIGEVLNDAWLTTDRNAIKTVNTLMGLEMPLAEQTNDNTPAKRARNSSNDA